ncbi:MAG: tRNA (N(6)-L-threonylcarbamoyladenosine(37)-C(2))-methylthiotransferase MtaB [Candidatus Omnitrophica bacterium]|nr:tRNA (N(6)-L-threonylcarbamoyladenosine(37)-C(2))-methylthiotransferase MtaB [Candidatus Omnitrophota bacterium]
MKKVHFLTLGCKVNQYETQAMRESLLRRGFEETKNGESDFIVINTCTVTQEADRENQYWIRRFRRENPNARIVVTGCWVKRNRKEIEALSGVDLILSNREKEGLADRLAHGCGTPEVQKRWEYDSLEISTFRGHGRAFLKIQDGCNHACTFCKVVLVRGLSRSRSLREIVEEAKRLSGSGFREVVLTGIQLGAYGLDLEPKSNLVSVLEALSAIPDIERIRLSSIEPMDVKGDLIQSIKGLPKVCPQLHIPLQSGDDEILKKMNRRYGRNFYLDLIGELRQEIPDFCLSMDVMIGFPGEEESHFENTLSLIKATSPIRIHAFPYSSRPGTRAARLENLPKRVIRERMQRFKVFSEEVVHKAKGRFLGRTFHVLVESKVSQGELYQGHTAHYLKVYFQASPEFLGKAVQVKLLEVTDDGILGRKEMRGRE